MIPFLALGLGIAWIGITFIVIIREELRPSVARPVAFGSVPMCYISLAFTAVIGVLYWLQLSPAADLSAKING